VRFRGLERLRLIQPSEGTEDRPEKRAEGRTKDQPEKQTQGQSKHCGSVVQAIVFQPNDPQRLMIAVGCRVYEYKMDAGARSELQCLRAVSERIESWEGLSPCEGGGGDGAF